MYETRLKHNSPDSLIRRPSGLKDAEWDSIVDESLARHVKNVIEKLIFGIQER